jgi:hypothetical protein
MEFRKCSIGGNSYGGYHTPDNPIADAQTTRPVKDKGKASASSSDPGMNPLHASTSEESMVDAIGKFYANPYLSEKISFVDERFVEDLFRGTDQSDIVRRP